MKSLMYKIFPSRYLAISVVTLCLFILAQSTADAQTKVTESLRDSVLRIPKPHLNGHKFITNQMVKDPFVRTYIRNTIGVGQTLEFQTPLFVINGNNLISLKGNLLYTSLDVEYQQAIRDWLAFSARFQITGRLGSEIQALFTSGVNVASGMELGWLVKVMENKNMALSGNVKVTNNSATYINLYDFIQEIIDSGKITRDNKLVKTTPLTWVIGGARYAYAFNKVFGATALFEIGYGSAIDRSKGDEWMTNFGIGFDADIMPSSGVPFGFGIAYLNTSYQYSETVLGRPQNLLVQINYTGRDDFDLGLATNYQWYREKKFDNLIQFVNIFVNMKYYF